MEDPSGNLYIRSVRGRNGDFSVGRLVTDIGEFVLRDEFLGQYGEGHYQGEFGIAEIYPASYVAGGRLGLEIRATLASGRCQERCRIFSFDFVLVQAFSDGWIYPG